MDDLIKRIKEECAGRDRWYVMNATEDGYCIDFDRERDADRWVADRLRESPGYMERNGYHVVKRRSFTSAEDLANEAAARLTALESERDALLAAAGKEAVPIGYVQASALPLLKRGAADTIFGDCHECADVPLYTAPTTAQCTVPEGWKLVPVEPTRAMIDEGFKKGTGARHVYAAMLAASPAAALEKGGGRDAEAVARHALAATDSDRIALIRALQKALAFWMPKVFDERSAHDAYLLIGYEGDDDQRCWGDEMVSAVSRWTPVSEQLPAKPGWYLAMLAPDNDWGLMSDTPLQVEFDAHISKPKAFTCFYDYRGDEDISAAVTHWQPLPAPPAAMSQKAGEQQ